MSEEGPGSDLLLVLEQSRDRGFLGPGPVVDHVEHAMAFLAAVGADFTGRGIDLGSGGGVPGLALATWLPAASWMLLDANLQRVRFLAAAVRQLGLTDRVQAVHGRAEDVGRDPQHRGAADLVVARSFGPPGVLAECAAPLLRVGGRLAVSEPPRAEGVRWVEAGLSLVGLEVTSIGEHEGRSIACLRQAEACPDRFPRRVGVPSRSPLF